MVTLSQISDERWEEKYGLENHPNKEQAIREFRRSCRNNLREIMDKLFLEDSFEMFKEKINGRLTYVFREEEVPFINRLLEFRRVLFRSPYYIQKWTMNT